MHRFIIISTMVLLFGVSAARAEEECGGGSTGSEPMDSHTEARLTRYLRGSSSPRTFRSTEEKVRWEWLYAEDQCEKANRRERHLGQRSTSIQDRLRIAPKPTDKDRALPVFDPTGPGSEPLSDSHREARVRQYAKSDNCQGGVLSVEDKERCIFLVQEQYELTRNALERRRQSSVAERSDSRRADRLNQRLLQQSYTEGPTSYSSKTGASERKTVDFDPTGPGSTPLDRGTEVRLRQYIESDKCPVTTHPEVTERCRWLNAQKNYLRTQQTDRTQKRLESRGLGNVRLTRGVRGGGKSVYTQYQPYLRVERLEKRGGAPRTIQEVEERFGIERGTGRRWRTNVIPGD
jgi:hypothetical protein